MVWADLGCGMGYGKIWDVVWSMGRLRCGMGYGLIWDVVWGMGRSGMWYGHIWVVVWGKGRSGMGYRKIRDGLQGDLGWDTGRDLGWGAGRSGMGYREIWDGVQGDLGWGPGRSGMGCREIWDGVYRVHTSFFILDVVFSKPSGSSLSTQSKVPPSVMKLSSIFHVNEDI